MAVLGTIAKIFSYFFHLVLSLGLIAISAVAVLSDIHNIQLTMLPWSGRQLTWWLLVLGLFGLVSLVLALKGVFRFLFMVWTVVVFFLLARGYLFSGYSFDGPDAFQFAMLLLAASFIAVLGGIYQMRSRRTLKPLR